MLIGPTLMLLMGGIVASTSLHAPAAQRVLEQQTTDPVQLKLRALLKEHRAALREALVLCQQRFQVGVETVDVLLSAAADLLKAELELCATPAERTARREQLLENTRIAERIVEARFAAGRISGQDYWEIKATRLRAEIELHREHMGVQPAAAVDLAQRKLKALLKEHRAALREVLALRRQRFQAGVEITDDLLSASNTLFQTELELCASPTERLALHESHRQIMRGYEKAAEERLRMGRIPSEEYGGIQAARLRIEIELERERAKARPAAEAEVVQRMLKVLRKERRDTLREVAALRQQRFQTGVETVAVLLSTSNALRQAELELCATLAERTAVHEQHVQNLRGVEKVATVRFDAGRISGPDYVAIQSQRLAAEIDLHRERARVKPLTR